MICAGDAAIGAARTAFRHGCREVTLIASLGESGVAVRPTFSRRAMW